MQGFLFMQMGCHARVLFFCFYVTAYQDQTSLTAIYHSVMKIHMLSVQIHFSGIIMGQKLNLLDCVLIILFTVVVLDRNVTYTSGSVKMFSRKVLLLKVKRNLHVKKALSLSKYP